MTGDLDREAKALKEKKELCFWIDPKESLCS
jgi:hypothetical protein